MIEYEPKNIRIAKYLKVIFAVLLVLEIAAIIYFLLVPR